MCPRGRSGASVVPGTHGTRKTNISRGNSTELATSLAASTTSAYSNSGISQGHEPPTSATLSVGLTTQPHWPLSKTFVNSGQGMQLTGPSNKIVVTANRTELPASNTVLLPTRTLSKGAREAVVVPGMSQRALMSMSTLANNGYTTIFLPGQQGVNVFHANDVNISAIAPPALHGWRDDRGLWMVTVADEPTISKDFW
jgi:hypothetical protein